MSTPPKFSDHRAFVEPKRVREVLDVTRWTEARMRQRGALPPLRLLPGTTQVWRYHAKELDAALEKICGTAA